MVACVAWWFLSNLRTLGKRENHDKKRQSREEPGRPASEKPLCVFAFKLLKPPSYAGYTMGAGGFFFRSETAIVSGEAAIVILSAEREKKTSGRGRTCLKIGR